MKDYLYHVFYAFLIAIVIIFSIFLIIYFNYFIKKLTSVPKNRKLVKDIDVKSYKGISVEIAKSGYNSYLILRSEHRSL
jgi:hypothetical protein